MKMNLLCEYDAALEFPVPTDYAKSMARSIAGRMVRGGTQKSARDAIAPRFEAAGNGGVGLHWKSKRRELLVSIPPEQDSRILFYGDTPAGNLIKGSLLPNGPVQFLAVWLVEHELHG